MNYMPGGEPLSEPFDETAADNAWREFRNQTAASLVSAFSTGTRASLDVVQMAADYADALVSILKDRP